MIFGWRGRGSDGKVPWVEVAPGERGTPEDEFTSFTYWIPSRSLEQEIQKDAKETGRRSLPDVTAPGAIDEPDGYSRLRGIVLDACSGRRSAAIELFKPERERIADLSAKLASTVTVANQGRARAQRESDTVELARKEAFLESLEDALEARLRQLTSYFETLSAEFVQELMQSHPFPSEVAARWQPEPLVLPTDAHDFGQETARAQIAGVRRTSGNEGVSE